MAVIHMVSLFTANQAGVTGLTLSQIDYTLFATNRTTGVTTTLESAQDAQREIGGGFYERTFTTPTSPLNDFSISQFSWFCRYTGTVYVDSAYVYNVEDEEIRSRTTLGAGAIAFTYTALDTGGLPIDDASVWVSTTASGSNIVASGRTIANGTIVVYLDAGTYYFFTSKSGFSFVNPDTEVVS